MTGLPDWLGRREAGGRAGECGGTGRDPFLDRTVAGVASFFLVAGDRPRGRGLLQSLDPGARLGGLFILIVAAAVTTSAPFMAVLYAAAAVIAGLSSVGAAALIKRVLPAIFLAALVALPAAFLAVKEPAGTALALPALTVSFTAGGAGAAALFIARAALMAALANIAFMTTTQAGLFRGLARLRAPQAFISAAFMTFRHLFLLLRLVADSALARRSRTICGTGYGSTADWFASRASFIMTRSSASAAELSMALNARGFNGRLRTLSNGPLGGRDLAWIGAASFVFFMAALAF